MPDTTPPPTKTPRVPKPKPEPVWLTRDSDSNHDGLLNTVQVWLRSPSRHKDDRGYFWTTDDPEADRKEVRTLNSAKNMYRTVPDDDRQCVKIG